MSQPIHQPVQHPAWCDPRVCDDRGQATVHAGTPATYRLAASDAVVSIGIIKSHDSAGCDPEPLHAVIGLEDPENILVDPTTLRAVDGWADANDLRILAALFIGFAERIEAGGDR